MDLFRPVSVRSINHKIYCLVITDEYTRFSWVFFMEHKSETYLLLKDFITLVENQFNHKVKCLRCDHGTEFKNAKFIDFCGEKGIKRDYSNPRTPQQNGVAERKNRTLIEAARTMLADSLLPTMSSSTNLSAGTQATSSTYAGSQDHDDSDSDDEQDNHAEKDALTELQRQAQAGMNLSNTFSVSAERSPPTSPVSAEAFNFAGRTINSAGRKSNSAGRSQDDLGGPSLRFPTPSELESSDLHDGSKIYNYPDSGIFTSSSYDDEYTGPDVTNMKSTIDVNPTATTRMEPASVYQALNDPDWVEAIQEEMQQFKNQQLLRASGMLHFLSVLSKKWISTGNHYQPLSEERMPKTSSLFKSLMYLTSSQTSGFAVMACARNQVSPTTSNLLAVKRIFKYLKAFPKLGHLVSFRILSPIPFEASRIVIMLELQGGIGNLLPVEMSIFRRRAISCNVKSKLSWLHLLVKLSMSQLLHVVVSSGGSKLVAVKTLLGLSLVADLIHCYMFTLQSSYLKVGEYDVWAMKMQNYISSTDLQCWNVVMKGNHARPTTTDSNGKIVYRDPVSADEYLVLQRESKARSTLISALPDEHMSDFNHMIDAKDIWDAIKAKFGSNEESRKLQKTMLKQAFAEFKMTSEEGLDKCYERMQKMLTQMNSLKIKPEQEEVNMCFLRALPESWRQVSLSLRARGGLDLLTFEDLYSKLKFLESDVRGYARPSHAAFVGSSSTSQNKPAVHGSNSSSSYPSYFPSPQTSSNEHSIKVSKVVDDVVYSLLADHEKDQQLCFDDLDQLNKQDLEEYDLKHQMAMLSIRVRRFEKKAGRKIKFNGRESARFDKQLVKCYKCHQKGHFSRECRAPTSQTEYSTYKAREEFHDKQST
ncbi:ribonuclease H-like domain-containing protein [Tanacetum coccineum]